MIRIVLFFLIIFGFLRSNAQNLRYCDTEIKISYPDSGHYFISPGSDSVGYWVYNHGPDTLFENDRFWLRVLLANKYLDPPIIVFLNKMLVPGDSMRFSSDIVLKYHNHVQNIDLCLTLIMLNAVNSPNPLFEERDSAEMFANNKDCIKVAHDRISQNIAIKEKPIFIFPNPFSSYIALNQDNVNKIVIYDLAGKLIYEGIDSKIETIEWASGLYIAQISATDGSLNYQKIIKN